MLARQADGRADLPRLADDVVPGDPGAAAIGPGQRGQHADHGGLARAVWAEQRADTAFRHRKVQPPQGPDLAEGFLQSLGLNDRHWTFLHPLDETTYIVRHTMYVVISRVRNAIVSERRASRGKMGRVRPRVRIRREEGAMPTPAPEPEPMPPTVPTPPPRRRGPRPRYGREDVARAAVAIADAEGLEAVTFRAVAARLGTGVMSLYNYIPDKQALVFDMADLIAAELALPAPTGDWRADMHVVAGRQRA